LFIDIILTSLDDCTVSFGKLPNVILKICDFLLFNSSLINHLAARGIPTYVWVLNEEAEFKRALEAGAAGIMTDYPSRLKLFTMKQ
jgi:glycerophosphoryl diester phosphodiesterase